MASPHGEHADEDDEDGGEVIESLDEGYVPLAAINLTEKMATASRSSPISLASVDEELPANDSAASEPVEGVCSFPGCLNPSPPVKLRRCGIPGCEEVLHHLCASALGEEEHPPRCFECFSIDEVAPAAAEPNEDPMSEEERDHAARISSESSEDGDKVPGTPDPGGSPMHMATTPETPKPSKQPTVIRLSPDRRRSPAAVNPRSLYGYGQGEKVPVRRDGSCFYHTVRYVIWQDPVLSTSPKVLAFIGDSAKDLRHNISELCNGRGQELLDGLPWVEAGLSINELLFDMRIGAPPPEQSSVPEVARYSPELLDDLAADAADVESLAAYGNLVKNPSHWGTVVCLCVVSLITELPWQFGQMESPATTDRLEPCVFIPSVQATPPDYDFEHGEHPKRVIHNGSDHFEGFRESVLSAPMEADSTDAEDEEEFRCNVPAQPKRTQPKRTQSKQGVTLAEALSKPLAEVLSAPLPNVDNGDQLLEELLAEGEAAARDAEAEIHKASTPLSKLLATHGSKAAVAEASRARARLEISKKMPDKAGLKPVIAVASAAEKAWKAAAKQAVAEGKAAAKQAVAEEKAHKTADKMAARDETADKTADETAERALVPVDLDVMSYMKQMEEKHEQLMKTMQANLDAQEQREKAQTKLREAAEQETKKLREAAARQEAKKAEMKLAERRRYQAKLEEEAKELQRLSQEEAELDGDHGAELDTEQPDDRHGRSTRVTRIIKLGDVITMTFGSRKRRRGTVTESLADGFYKCEMDDEEVMKIKLAGAGAKAFEFEETTPPELVRFKNHEVGKLFNDQRSIRAGMAGLDETSTAYAITDSLDMFFDGANKGSKEWIDSCGIGSKVFVPTLNSTDSPKPMDLMAVVRFEKDSSTANLSHMEIYTSGVLTYDVLTKATLQGSEKTIGIQVAVFGAGASADAAVANKEGRKYKPSTDEKTSLHVPLEIRSLSADINSFSETRYISCPTPADLQSLIGVSAYMDAVKYMSAHPLYRPLVESGWPAAMGCSDILTALRALADGDTNPGASEILAKFFCDHAARSVSAPINKKYEPLLDEGILKKEEKRALEVYNEKVTKMFSILSPGTSEVSKLLPRVQSRAFYKHAMESAKGSQTPVLPRIKPAKPRNVPASASNVPASNKVPATDGVAPPSSAPSAAAPSTGGSLSSAPQPRKLKTKISPLAAESSTPVDSNVAPATNRNQSTADGCVRKSALAHVEGSPHKSTEGEEGSKRGKVCSPEDLAESINTLPAMLGKMAEAANIFKDAQIKDDSAKDTQIVSLKEQIVLLKERITALETNQAALQLAQMEALVKAAKAEGIAEQLQENLTSKERQLTTWVSRKFAIAHHLADLALCDEEGSILPP